MTKEQILQDFNLIKKMHAPMSTKISFLTNLFANQDNPWRVIGITQEALVVFAHHDFKKVSRMGINRSHLVARNETYRELLGTEFENTDQWWDFYFSRDMTILSTSSENMSSNFSEVYVIDENHGLFKTSGYAWKHGKEETAFLTALADQFLK